MNKTKFFSSLLVAGLFTVTSVFVSCKDYDDEIQGLKESIASNATAIESLQSLKDQGIVITNVQQNGKDVVLTLSDGTTKTIKGGQDATPADVWTIGEDGFWYKNSVKTDYKAVGTNGKDGINGTNGADGQNGQNGFNGTDGLYYVPNQSTGCFDIYNGDGTFKESTSIRWREENVNGAPKIVAIQTAKSVILMGVEGYGDVVIPTAADLESLVFLPKTYYWGIEATTVRTLTMKWYNITKDLITYIDKAADRTEVIGTKRPLSPENPINYLPYDGTTWTAPDGLEHERYPYGAGTITVTLKANAEYHINPSIAWFDNTTSVDVISDNTTFTRSGMGNAIVSFRGNKTGEDHAWKVEKNEKGVFLNVPLNVNGTVSTVTTNGKSNFATNPGVTMFATQVTYKNDKDETCVVTSDYAAIVEETVKDLKIAHVPYNLEKAPYQLSETGMLNHHCGRCDLPKYTGSPYYFGDLYRGVHLFQSIDECKAYIQATPRCDNSGYLGEGWDLVNYQEDIDLNALVETHYTNVNGTHDVFDNDDFDRNFEYAFELTSVKLGDNNTDESAHAALYFNEETKHWYLHPQDPEVGGLNGRPYDAAKATDVVVNRVPVVRVKLIYKDEKKVIDYAYLPIRITKEVKEVARPTVVVNYSTDKAHQIIRYNDCWNAGGQSQDLIVTTWRQTEEDLYSAPGLAQIFDRQLFDNTYRVEVKPGGAAATFGSAIDAQQYLVTKNADGTYSFKKVDTPHTATIVDDQFGTINYTENTVGGHTSSIFTWNADGDDIRDFAVAGVTQVVRAVRLYANDGNPDIFVIFTSGALSLTKYTVVGDPNLKANIIAKYWYESGKFDQGTDEIHANTITPEENDGDKADLTENGWKPKDFDDRFADVFYGNFRTMSGKSTRPVTWITYKVYDENGAEVNQAVPNPPFAIDNYEADFFFADVNNGKEFKGYLDNGEAKTFVLKNTQIAFGGDKSKKNLYARLKSDPDQDIYYQLIATIDEWDLRTIGQLREMKIALNWGNPRISDDPGAYAKALLNYKSHSKIGDPDVLDVKVAINAVTKIYKANGADLVDPVVSTGIACPLVLENNTFSVRFLRPVDIDETNNPEIEDAHAKDGVEKQKVYLKDLVVLYKDWRDVRFKLTPDYEQYYAPVDESKLIAEVADVVLNQNLSANPNVKTDLNGTIEPLAQVSADLQLILKQDAEGKYIEYTNNSSNVQDFNIYIPVKVQYYWGTMYDDVILHVKRTKANAPRK